MKSVGLLPLRQFIVGKQQGENVRLEAAPNEVALIYRRGKWLPDVHPVSSAMYLSRVRTTASGTSALCCASSASSCFRDPDQGIANISVALTGILFQADWRRLPDFIGKVERSSYKLIEEVRRSSQSIHFFFGANSYSIIKTRKSYRIFDCNNSRTACSCNSRSSKLLVHRKT